MLDEFSAQDLQSGQGEAARISVEQDFAEFAASFLNTPRRSMLNAKMWRYEPRVGIGIFLDSVLTPEDEVATEGGVQLLNDLFVRNEMDLILNVKKKILRLDNYFDSRLNCFSDENGVLQEEDLAGLDLFLRGALHSFWNSNQALIVALNRKIVSQPFFRGMDTRVMGVGYSDYAIALIGAYRERDMDLIRRTVAHEVLHLLGLDSSTQTYDLKGHCCSGEPCLMSTVIASNDLCSAHVIGMKAYYKSMMDCVREKTSNG